MNRKGQDMGCKKILIVRLDRLGDVLLSTPVIKAARDAYPDSHIAVMVRPYARDIVEGNPYLNEVILYDKSGRENGLAGNIKFIQKLRKKAFDLAIMLHPTTRTHIITFLSGIPVRVGYDKKWAALLTTRIPHTKQYGLKHEREYAMDVLRYIGIDSVSDQLFMPIASESEARVDKMLNSAGISAKDAVVAINPGASCASKRWSAERFAKVADGLISKYDVKIIIVSDIRDKFFADRTASYMKNSCLNLSGKTSVADLASILKRAKLFISNDSGPVHIACAVGTPVVAIFGRSDRGLSPARWGPTGAASVVLHKDVGCEVCMAHNCRIGYKCLEAIKVEEVIEAAGRLIRS